jgi:hypothetical protein
LIWNTLNKLFSNEAESENLNDEKEKIEFLYLEHMNQKYRYLKKFSFSSK